MTRHVKGYDDDVMDDHVKHLMKLCRLIWSLTYFYCDMCAVQCKNRSENAL